MPKAMPAYYPTAYYASAQRKAFPSSEQSETSICGTLLTALVVRLAGGWGEEIDVSRRRNIRQSV
jgi:hypothetical protein